MQLRIEDGWLKESGFCMFVVRAKPDCFCWRQVTPKPETLNWPENVPLAGLSAILMRFMYPGVTVLQHIWGPLHHSLLHRS